MCVIVKFANGETYSFTFEYANEVDKLISALNANVDNWTVIEITITQLGPKLKT